MACSNCHMCQATRTVRISAPRAGVRVSPGQITNEHRCGGSMLTSRSANPMLTVCTVHRSASPNSLMKMVRSPRRGQITPPAPTINAYDRNSSVRLLQRSSHLLSVACTVLTFLIRMFRTMSTVLFHDVYAMVHQPRLAKRIYFMHRRHIYTMMRKATDPYAAPRAVRAYMRPGITKYTLDTILLKCVSLTVAERRPTGFARCSFQYTSWSAAPVSLRPLSLRPMALLSPGLVHPFL